MIRGFYSAASGLMTQQANLDTIANNMANVSTTAYKPQSVSFSDLLHQNMNGDGLEPVNYGSGVKVGKTDIDFAQGELQQTDMPMDCAILGQGFFSVQSPTDETIRYTRDGSFKLSLSDSENFLVTASGDYVLSKEGDKISLAKDTLTGDLIFDPAAIGVVTFPNQYGLQPAGGNKYNATTAAGEAVEVIGASVKIGYLESSGVDISKEMVKVIEASKAFSFNSRLVQVADEIEKIVNQLR